MIHPPPIAQCGQAMYQMQVTIAPTIQAPYSAQHGQAMYKSATNQIYQSITQPTVMEPIYQNAIPHGQVQMMYLSSSQPMATQAVYHRETHQQQPPPMCLFFSTAQNNPCIKA